ncbi:c-type cytochrome [Burkholderia plantarii]|uniref:c-type cytochrome n=1 Tax=Burkholderia plantarii TaxID=41899 RepID=UPI00087073D2|nr:cytochrome c [Burkholderia plantarii]
MTGRRTFLKEALVTGTAAVLAKPGTGIAQESAMQRAFDTMRTNAREAATRARDGSPISTARLCAEVWNVIRRCRRRSRRPGRPRAVHAEKGCYECHGISGQGSIGTGPARAPPPLPLAAMPAYVHAPTGQMPRFSAKILSNDDIARIHAYLDSIPANPPVAAIALLNDGTVGTHGTRVAVETARVGVGNAHGASIFAANCAGCHGPRRGTEARRHRDNAVARWRGITYPRAVRDHAEAVSETLDATDVRDVARHVTSLTE